MVICMRAVMEEGETVGVLSLVDGQIEQSMIDVARR